MLGRGKHHLKRRFTYSICVDLRLECLQMFCPFLDAVGGPKLHLYSCPATVTKMYDIVTLKARAIPVIHDLSTEMLCIDLEVSRTEGFKDEAKGTKILDQILLSRKKRPQFPDFQMNFFCISEDIFSGFRSDPVLYPYSKAGDDETRVVDFTSLPQPFPHRLQQSHAEIGPVQIVLNHPEIPLRHLVARMVVYFGDFWLKNCCFL